MRIFDLHFMWVIALDAVGWFLVHFLVGQLITLISYKKINPNWFIFRKMPWENESFFKNVFFIHLWKKYLPEGSYLYVGGYYLKKMESMNDINVIDRYLRESCKAEIVHLIVILFIPLFYLFNYWWGNIICTVVVLFVNIPCGISQRYNRIRLLRYKEILIKKKSRAIK